MGLELKRSKPLLKIQKASSSYLENFASLEKTALEVGVPLTSRRTYHDHLYLLGWMDLISSVLESSVGTSTSWSPA
jgi:hypothetical protein